jgi:hypothetical protein
VSDLHLRTLRMLAKQRQRELDDHDAGEPTGDAAASRRRRELKRAAARTSANVAAAEARRRHPPPDHGR